MKTLLRKSAISALSTLILLTSAQSAIAAPGNLATAPLFVTTAVEPNVFFTYDDSGSMDWETMVEDGTAGFSSNGGVPSIRTYTTEYFSPPWERDCNVVPPVDLHPDSWVFINHHGNKTYYNPEVTYTPWPGVDSAGDPLFTDANPTSVKQYPYSGSSATVDLTTKHTYYLYNADFRCRTATVHGNIYWIPTYSVWEDTDEDGVIELSDDHEIVRIAAGTDEMQNFANWFQYYRSREMVSKASLGRVINNTDSSRMGMDSFNSGHQADLASMGDISNKEDLLNELYGEWVGGGTPAHSSVDRVGDYFKGSSAILSASNGGECQQNFNIVMTDGFWNSFVNPGVGNADSSGSGGETDASGVGFDGNQDESNDGGNYEDSYSNTLADLAMHLYETDLRPDLDDRVPPQAGVDEAEHQHLVTYTIGFGLNGTLNPETDDPTEGGSSFWPNPMDTEDEERVDDLWHASYNARGKFLSASNPEELQASLDDAIADIAERTATAAAASVTSARLTTESLVFLSEFNTNRWQGTVYAYPIIEEDIIVDGEPVIDEDTGEAVQRKVLSDTPSWSASEELEGADPDDRTILTYDKTGEKDGVPFLWDNITSDMQDDLRTNAVGGTDAVEIGQARLEFLRGSRINEGDGYAFRERASVLGDVVHSAPVYVSEPSLFWPDGGEFPDGDNAYSEYKEDHSDDPETDADESRNGIIYVGANDGMVHGFDEDSGAEVLAYVPSYLASDDTSQGLHYLTQQNYQHRFYNDLTPTVSDVYIDSTGSGAVNWRTVLITGQRAGGKGYSALDVTDPAAFSEANAKKLVMWEFTSDDDADLGYTFARPQVGLANDGSWVAVFGNGYNNSGSGTAQLFIVKLEGGVDGTWSATDYIKIDTGEGSAADLNGLSAVQLADTDQNGTIDRAYGGDLFGNLWAFDLSSSTSTDWKVAMSGSPLFTTIDNRPITSRPSISLHPTIAKSDDNAPNIMVAFGTGQYLVPADNVAPHPDNYFYGVWDKDVGGLTSSDLLNQGYDSGFSVRVTNNDAVDYSSQYGWYIDLPDSAERVYTNSVIRSGYVFFNSSIPSVDACSSGGYGYRFTLKLTNGGPPDEPIIDLTGEGIIDEEDALDDSKAQSAARLDDLPTDDTLVEDYIINQRTLTKISEAPERKVGRVSWQELIK